MERHVFVYFCNARMAGNDHLGEEWNSDCLLFVTQAAPEPDYEAARTLLIDKHDLSHLAINDAGPLDLKDLTSPDMSIWLESYEQCLQQGDVFVWYA